MTRQAHSIGNGVPNPYLQAMEQVRELEAFAVVVYSSNFEFEEPGYSAINNLNAASARAAAAAEDAELMDGPMADASFIEAEAEVDGDEATLENAWDNAVEGGSSTSMA
jgi:peroxin-3